MAKEFMHLLTTTVPERLSLTRQAQQFLQEHTDEALIAVQAAIEAAAAHHAYGNPGSLQQFIVDADWDREGIVTITEAAVLLGVNRKTVTRWVADHRLLGWKTTKRGLAIPKEQILGRERVVDGIRELLDVIDQPELAWSFLSQPWPFEDEVARPIDLLRLGRMREVLEAAPSFGSSVT